MTASAQLLSLPAHYGGLGGFGGPGGGGPGGGIVIIIPIAIPGVGAPGGVTPPMVSGANTSVLQSSPMLARSKPGAAPTSLSGIILSTRGRRGQSHLTVS
jgi:hypothetical protein